MLLVGLETRLKCGVMMSTPSTPQKRPHVGGSGHTPSGKRRQHKHGKKDGGARRPLSFLSPKITRSLGHMLTPKIQLAKSPRPVKHHQWTDKEDKALIQFLDLSHLDQDENVTDTASWPMRHANSPFWTEAATSIKTATRSSELLSANTVRNRCRKWRTKFDESLEAAVKSFGLETNSISRAKKTKETVSRGCQTKKLTVDQQTQTEHSCQDDVTTVLSSCKALTQSEFDSFMLMLLPQIVQSSSVLSFGDKLFSVVATAKNISTYPTDFFSKSINAMSTLQEHNKPNILYKFAHILSTNRPGTSTPLLQIDRMPFGLLQYQMEFFSATNVHQVSISPDYASWLESMCAEFPTRFLRLFRGPGWSGLESTDLDPLKAHINVAAPSLDTMYRLAQTEKFDGNSSIHIAALESFAKMKPGARVWFKADACDLKVALQTSTKDKWAGDVDLGDGSLEKLRADNDRRMVLVREAGKSCVPRNLEACLFSLLQDLGEDIDLLKGGLEAANKRYKKKFEQANSSTDVLKNLAWDRVEYNTLLEQAKAFYERYERLLAALGTASPQPGRVAQCLVELREDNKTYLHNLFKKKRVAADHALVVMVSDERRNQKPYAVPILLIPYHSIRDQFLQQFLDKCHEEAKKLGLIPVGDVTDGEFNSLRTLGNKRPIHLYEIIRGVKDSVRRMASDTVLKSLRKVGEDDNGMPLTELREKAIPPEVIEEYHKLTTVEQMREEDAVVRLRGQLVPPDCGPSTFRANSPECMADMLRSIMATYRYRLRIEELRTEGVDFTHHMYVPEKDGLNYLHRREDHCHLLKRIAGHLRKEPPRWFNHHALEEALHPQDGEPKPGLTEAALFGFRKQSVTDAEILLSYNMVRFLRHRGYHREACYIEVVAGWHEAADGRGLSEEERKEKNTAMMDMILDELMPYHRSPPWRRYPPDFSTLDINRFGRGVLGWSRETLIAVTTNIESMELRRSESATIGYEEHPRASTTDDVECFFAGLHRHMGNTFTLKELHARWPTEVREFSKRIDPDLPFYYWTISERFREAEDTYPSFNDDPEDGRLRLHRLRTCRREDASIFTTARGVLPVRNRGTIRQILHRPEVPLPEVPNSLPPV
ncbi:uncharacterized protein LOC144887927 isoform X2 [Branchiostoma floridae x Branchiostoma japonicum]